MRASRKRDPLNNESLSHVRALAAIGAACGIRVNQGDVIEETPASLHAAGSMCTFQPPGLGGRGQHHVGPVGSQVIAARNSWVRLPCLSTNSAVNHNLRALWIAAWYFTKMPCSPRATPGLNNQQPANAKAARHWTRSRSELVPNLPGPRW
jgi:hypothetical protein